VGVIPIKMYDGMACARPLVLAIEGEARMILDDAQAGIAVDPEQPEQLLAGIRALQKDATAAHRFGENGRRYVERYFSREHCAGLLLSALRRGLEG
jgi:glycosyltransferase involved in cell wall biosynthesis